MVAWTGGVLEFRPRRGVSKHQLVHVMREKQVCDVYNCSDFMAYYLEYMVVENKEHSTRCHSSTRYRSKRHRRGVNVMI